MRTTTLTTAGLLGLALLSPITTASAAGETCRGEAATIVGTGPTITGTEGRDVVVTNGATHIDTLGGDDAICVTAGGADTVLIDSGSGNDVVDGTGSPAAVRAELGAGADRYEGGNVDGSVVTGGTAGPYGNGELSDTEKDVVIAGAGENGVISGQPGQPNPDVIDLGAGDDGLGYWGAMTPGGSINGGDGSDWFSHNHLRSGDTVVDNAAGRLTVGGQLMATWSGLEGFEPRAIIGYGQQFIGSEGADTLEIAGTPGPIRASFGAGADTLKLYGEPHTGSTIDGGSGRDLLYAASKSGLLDLDLRAGELRADAEAQPPTPTTAPSKCSVPGIRVPISRRPASTVAAVATTSWAPSAMTCCAEVGARTC